LINRERCNICLFKNVFCFLNKFIYFCNDLNFNRMIKYIITGVFSLTVLFSFGQIDTVNNSLIVQDARVDSLVKFHIKANEFDPAIEGWRIQIFFEAGNYSKSQAIEAKSNFVNKYSNVPVYLIFQEPYYKVRIGDYRTKMEAEAFLKKISGSYPNAFVVKDEINFPKLNADVQE